MTDDITKCEKMKAAGSSQEELYLEAARNGIDPITRIRLIRSVCAFSPGQAKEVIMRAEGQAESLNQYQDKIVDNLLRVPGTPYVTPFDN
jgi:hypothetical protein